MRLYFPDKPRISDHAQISFSIITSNHSHSDRSSTTRNWNKFDYASFENDIRNSELCLRSDDLDLFSLDDIFNIYQRTLCQLLDVHAPLGAHKKRLHDLTPWFDEECRDAKRRARRLKQRFYKSNSVNDRAMWIAELKSTSALYQSERCAYWRSMIVENTGNPKKLWSVMNDVIGRGYCPQPARDLTAQNFSDFFITKTEDVAQSTASAPPPTIVSTASVTAPRHSRSITLCRQHLSRICLSHFLNPNSSLIFFSLVITDLVGALCGVLTHCSAI